MSVNNLDEWHCAIKVEGKTKGLKYIRLRRNNHIEEMKNENRKM
jgi:hypothetical protein